MALKQEVSPFFTERLRCPPEYGYWPNAILKLFLTQACDLCCPGCFNKPHLKVTGTTDRPQTLELTQSQVYSLMNEARNLFNTYGVEFSGGEPTLREDLPDFIRYAKSLGYVTRIVTNGSILGAWGEYRNQLADLLPEGLKKLQPGELVDRYLEAGLDRITISVDNMHTIDDKDLDPGKTTPSKVPVSVVTNAVQLLLDRRIGYHNEGDNILNGHRICIGMTASGKDYVPSRRLVEQVMFNVGARPVLKKGETLPKVWVTEDGQEIQLSRNETASIGLGANMDIPAFGGNEDLFKRNCFDFLPRSRAIVGGNINQEIVVNYDGTVYNCAMQSFPLGHIGTHTLGQIVEYVNNGNPPEEYRVGVLMFMEIMKIAEETRGQGGWGEAYRRILLMDPSLQPMINQLRSHSGACHALGHNDYYLKLLQQYRLRTG